MEFKKITQKKLDKILELHDKWLKNEEGGVKADFQNLYLYGIDLSNRDLSGVDFSYANLSEADLSHSNLSGAYLNNASLYRADLSDANLAYANLSNAAMCHATLHNTDLHGSNLYMADLSKANLTIANLRHVSLIAANLTNALLFNADLTNANLAYSDLTSTDLRHANLIFATLVCANLDKTILDVEEKIRYGVILTTPITGWKKCCDGIIVELEIPAGSIVFSINNSKCRTNHAIVKSIEGADVAHSTYCYSFEYRVGDDIIIDDFDLKYNIECGEGIHFFRTKEEAKAY